MIKEDVADFRALCQCLILDGLTDDDACIPADLGALIMQGILDNASDLTGEISTIQHLCDIHLGKEEAKSPKSVS